MYRRVLYLPVLLVIAGCSNFQHGTPCTADNNFCRDGGGSSDAGVLDAGGTDAGSRDGGNKDGGVDAGVADGGKARTVLEIVPGSAHLSGGTMTMDVQIGPAPTHRQLSGGTQTLESNSAIKP